jgi:hypothetical protein
MEQQIEALSTHFGRHEVDAGDISARSVKTIDKPNPDRVGGLHKNDRDRPDLHRLDRTSLRLAHSFDHLVGAQQK